MFQWALGLEGCSQVSGAWSFLRAGGGSKWESPIKEVVGAWTLAGLIGLHLKSVPLGQDQRGDLVREQEAKARWRRLSRTRRVWQVLECQVYRY